MASKMWMRVEESTVILNGHGSGHKDVRVAIDGTVTEVKEPKMIARYSGSWKDGTFEYVVAFERLEAATYESIKSIRRSFRMTEEGLLVTVVADYKSELHKAVAIYRLAENIPMPTPVKAVIGDAGWLAGDWVGTRSTGSPVEERWSPPGGGAMLATSRSINKSGKMFAFEYLRIVERDGGLVYIAQPGGKTATEFVLTELTPARAVFENPRHDYPKRIVYELSAEGTLTATAGFMKGGTPQRFEFKRESK